MVERQPTRVITRASLQEVRLILRVGELEDLIRALDEGRFDDLLSPWSRRRMIEDLGKAR